MSAGPSFSTKAPEQLIYAPVRFSDVDEFSQWEIDLGWDIDSVQLSAGANEIGFDNFQFPEMLIGRFWCRQEMHNFFEVPRGMMMFLICRAKLPLVWCGIQHPPTLMGIVHGGQNQWAVLPAGHDCYEFMVSEDWIRQSELFPRELLKRTEVLEDAFLPLASAETEHFLSGLDAFFRIAGSSGHTHEPWMYQAAFREFILQGLLALVDAGLAIGGTPRPPRTRRPDLVVKARDLFLANIADEWTADRIALELGVSYRVLNYAFKETTGISPYQYFLNERLQAARRRLKADDASITQICFDCGFNTPSRFARQYARLFGELPSETRHRTFTAIAQHTHA